MKGPYGVQSCRPLRQCGPGLRPASLKAQVCGAASELGSWPFVSNGQRALQIYKWLLHRSS